VKKSILCTEFAHAVRRLHHQSIPENSNKEIGKKHLDFADWLREIK
jgi:hypothetical protein